MARKKKKNIMKIKSGKNEQHTIYGYASPGTLAEYMLLKLRFYKMDDTWMLAHFKKGDQLKFNTDFLMSMQDKHGPLHCEFCGKQHLVIYPWYEKGDRSKMATADHFYPKSFDREALSKDLRNMVVACNSCNNNKADYFWKLETLKFPYPETIDKLKELYNDCTSLQGQNA